MFIVTKDNFESVKEKLLDASFIGLDSETTGLSSFHGDRLFSLALATDNDVFYFNFQEYPDIPSSFILDRSILRDLQDVFQDPSKVFFAHNAKFDLHMLYREGIELQEIFCTYVGERLCNNLNNSLSLSDCADRIGEQKDEAVENWIKANKAYKKYVRENQIFRDMDFTQVPFSLIAPYACKDAELTLKLGMNQLDTLSQWCLQKTMPNAMQVALTECELTKVLLKMERVGVQIDVAFCRKALHKCYADMEASQLEFSRITGKDYKSSSKIFEKVFLDEKDKWQYTEKGNPSFVAKVLRTFESTAARCIIRYKNAKSEADFFANFLTLADVRGEIHTSFNPGRARTGRFSSSKPNLQNLKRNKEVTEEENYYQVRGAFIPRDGFFFVSIDYEQIEYRVMLDQARAFSLIEKVKGGLDVHEATAQVAGVTRQQAKTVNFLTLYGGGIAKLAAELKVDVEKAKEIQASIFKSAPEVRTWMRQVIDTAKHKNIKLISNWYGRRLLYPDSEKEFAYRAPNYLIQGGCADIIKIAMCRIDRFLVSQNLKSRMILTIHDELVFEIAYGEEHIVSTIASIMRSAYPHRYLPLEVDIEYSIKNLAVKKPWASFMSDPDVTWLGVKETRDFVQGEVCSRA